MKCQLMQWSVVGLGLWGSPKSIRCFYLKCVYCTYVHRMCVCVCVCVCVLCVVLCVCVCVCCVVCVCVCVCMFVCVSVCLCVHVSMSHCAVLQVLSVAWLQHPLPLWYR